MKFIDLDCRIQEGGGSHMKHDQGDPFVSMMTAESKVALSLSDFTPRSMLRVAEHSIDRPKFPAIDFHNHIDGMQPSEVLRMMDTCGIEHLVNITMKPGIDGIDSLIRLNATSAGRFSTIAWMDWRDLGEDGFFERSVGRLERCVTAGAIGMKIWKDLGLRLRDRDGSLLRIDDSRLDPLFARAAELGVFIMFHTADPAAFFLPTDASNERYEELSAHPDWSFYGAEFSREELLAQRNRVFARHPNTRFVAAHMGEQPEDLAALAAMLEVYPHVQLDMSARVAELGRQPFSARRFFLRFADRILFGADLLPEESMYRAHYRFLETEDEYFDYPSHASRQGRWRIYGLALPDAVLERIYRGNATDLLAFSK
jgi:predicted TIM-barrel fold metal-dependent hydrolase